MRARRVRCAPVHAIPRTTPRNGDLRIAYGGSREGARALVGLEVYADPMAEPMVGVWGTGGFLATFDGPQRAIRCAMAIRDAVQALGIEVRASSTLRDLSSRVVPPGRRWAGRADGLDKLVIRRGVVGSWRPARLGVGVLFGDEFGALPAFGGDAVAAVLVAGLFAARHHR